MVDQIAKGTGAYFANLNYTSSNEDTRIETQILAQSGKKALAIAGSGSRVLPLLASAPELLTCVDFSEYQLMLTKLRFETLRILSHREFCEFWGYLNGGMSYTERKDVFDACLLADSDRDFLTVCFEKNEWGPLITTGRWESQIIQMSKLLRATLGTQTIEKMFAITQREDFCGFLVKEFPHVRFRTVAFLLFNNVSQNILLYNGKAPKKTIAESFYSHFMSVIATIANRDLPRENFFMQLLFLGEYRYPSGLPAEADPVNYETARKNLANCEVQFEQGDFFQVLSKKSRTFDFVSISDIPSYFPDELLNSYLKKLERQLARNGRVVTRYYLREPSNLDFSGFALRNEDFKAVLELDRTPFYRTEIWEKKA